MRFLIIGWAVRTMRRHSLKLNHQERSPQVFELNIWKFNQTIRLNSEMFCCCFKVSKISLRPNNLQEARLTVLIVNEWSPWAAMGATHKFSHLYTHVTHTHTPQADVFRMWSSCCVWGGGDEVRKIRNPRKIIRKWRKCVWKRHMNCEYSF